MRKAGLMRALGSSGSGSRYRWLRRASSAVAGVWCLALVAFVPAPAASAARPPYAHAATVFHVGECSFLSATAQEYGVFKLVLRKYQWTDGPALAQAVANAEGALATADADSDNVPAMIAEAKPALGYIAARARRLTSSGWTMTA